MNEEPFKVDENDKQPLPVLEYRTPDARSQAEITVRIASRVIASTACAVFSFLAVPILAMGDRGIPAGTVSAAGALFCFLVAIDVITIATRSGREELRMNADKDGR
jgi:hypothetical protein